MLQMGDPIFWMWIASVRPLAIQTVNHSFRLSKGETSTVGRWSCRVSIRVDTVPRCNRVLYPG